MSKRHPSRRCERQSRADPHHKVLLSKAVAECMGSRAPPPPEGTPLHIRPTWPGPPKGTQYLRRRRWWFSTQWRSTLKEVKVSRWKSASWSISCLVQKTQVSASCLSQKTRGIEGGYSRFVPSDTPRGRGGGGRGLEGTDAARFARTASEGQRVPSSSRGIDESFRSNLIILLDTSRQS